MKQIILLLIVCFFCIVVSCQKKADPTPSAPTPQQLLLGTWKQTKYVLLQKRLDGTIISKDSTTHANPNAYFGITFNADGTTSSPAAITNDYVFSPPTITYSVPRNGFVTGTSTVIKLTAQELVMQSRRETSTSLFEYTYSYAK